MRQKIDIHTHILPREIPRWMDKFGYGGFVGLEHHRHGCARMLRDDGRFFREIQDNCWDPDVRIHRCDEVNVAVQVLSTVPVLFNYWAKPKDALETSRFFNDHIAEIVAKYPARFVGLGTLPLQESDLAIRELERVVKDLKFPGVQIGSNVNGRNLDDPEIFRVLSAAEKMGACVFVHPWDMLAPERMSKYWLPWLVGMPTELSIAICSLIFSGTLEKLPRLRIAFAHGGGSFSGSLGRIRHGYHARPDLCAIDNAHPPDHYTKRFFIDSLVHDEDYLRYLITLHGPDRIALGTDYPFPLGEDHPGQMIESMGLDSTAIDRLFSGTACEWLGLKFGTDGVLR